jgi:hypothetical protein
MPRQGLSPLDLDLLNSYLWINATEITGGATMIGVTIALIVIYVLFNRCTKQADGNQFCKL